MNPTRDEVVAEVAKQAGDELQDAVKKIKHCLDQLSAEQIWWRSSESMNSIGNLVLHIGGNVRQWIIAGVGITEDARDRPSEFSERGPLPTDELLSGLNAVIAQAQSVLSAATADDLIQQRRIQGFEVTGMQAIFESVAHFRGHTQEIVHMTRCLLGDDYKFAFVPSTPEQGAPQN